MIALTFSGMVEKGVDTLEHPIDGRGAKTVICTGHIIH